MTIPKGVGMELVQEFRPVGNFKNNMAAVLRKLSHDQSAVAVPRNGEAKGYEDGNRGS